MAVLLYMKIHPDDPDHLQKNCRTGLDQTTTLFHALADMMMMPTKMMMMMCKTGLLISCPACDCDHRGLD